MPLFIGKATAEVKAMAIIMYMFLPSAEEKRDVGALGEDTFCRTKYLCAKASAEQAWE